MKHAHNGVDTFEPVKEISIESPIGNLSVFDPDPNGIHAENHSINFNEDGTIESVITSSNQIMVTNNENEEKLFSPKIVTSYCNENAFFISPLKIIFEKDSISFLNDNAPKVSLSGSLHYKISNYTPDKPISGIGCS
jgi:hypothetical protein